MNHRHRSIILALLICGLKLCCPASGQCATPAKTTILLLNRISLTDLHANAGPFLRAKISESALGLITTNTAGTRSAGNTHATLGAGSPAFSDRPGGLALNFNEKWMDTPAGLLYQQLTGDPSFPAGKVIIPRLPEAVRLNFSAVRTSIPCLLGQVLQENHRTTAVLGNSDLAPTEEDPYYTYARFAPWLAADERGLVSFGEVGVDTLQRTNGLLPWTTNYSYLAAKYREYRESADLIVVELGDFARLDALSAYLYDRQISAEKQNLFTRLDSFLHTLWPLVDWEAETVFLLTPTPTITNLKQGAYLTPCLVWGKNFSSGLLSSPTTRRPGLVANVDLTPTVLHLFNLTTPGWATGRPMNTGFAGKLTALLSIEMKINATSYFRRKVLPAFLNGAAFLLPVIILGAGVLRKLAGRLWANYRAYLQFFTLLISTLPLALHLASQPPLTSPVTFVFLTGGIAIFSTLSSWALVKRRKITPLVFLLPLVLFTLLTIADLLSGATLIKNSVLGYDPMLGARYYGIGNELAGLFLGSMLGILIGLQQLNATPSLSSRAIWLFLTAMAILAAPRIGANFGAGLTALAMALTLWVVQRQSSTCPSRQLPVLFLILTFFIATLLSFDFIVGGPDLQSHFGLLLENFQTRGVTALGEIIFRKLQVNVRLLSTRWTLLFLSGLLSFTVTAFRAPIPRSPFFTVALIGGLVGLVCNDSGLVFSALFFYPLATTGLLSLLSVDAARNSRS